MKRQPKSFTLIELLGVIAILAILAAVAFPAIDNAITKSRTAASTQNLKQIGIALKSYVADKGHFPAASFKFTQGGNEVRQRWYNILSPYLNADERALTNAQGNTTISNRNGDKDSTVFSSVFKDPTANAFEVGRNNSYGYNFHYLGNARSNSAVGTASRIYRGQQVRGFINYPVKGSDIKRPDRTIAVAGSDGTGGSLPYQTPETMGSTELNDGDAGDIVASDRLAALGNEGYQLDPTFLPIRDLDNDGVVDYDGATVGNTDDLPGAGGGSSRHHQGARGIITNRHNGGTPVLFADGHVEFLLREDAYFDRSLGVFSNRLWNGFGVGNDRNGDGALTGETLVDPNEAWTTAGQAAVNATVEATLAAIGLTGATSGQGLASLATSTTNYGSGFLGDSDPTVRALLAGPTLPKARPFVNLEVDNLGALTP